MRGSAGEPLGTTVERGRYCEAPGSAGCARGLHLRILYLHQYFMTRAGVGGTRSYEFARRFVARGHEVTMVTAASSAEDVRRDVDGIDVVPVRAGFSDYVSGTAMSYPRRAAAFGQFAAAAA